MQCHNQPSGRRQGIQSFRLGSKSGPCGLTFWTGCGLLAFIIQLIQSRPFLQLLVAAGKHRFRRAYSLVSSAGSSNQHNVPNPFVLNMDQMFLSAAL